MGLFKSSDPKHIERGLSLLQALAILAVLGIVASLVLSRLIS